MTTALGVDVDTNGNGLDPLAHRQIIRRNWNNMGVVSGLSVSGRSDLYYGVSAGVAVCSMGDADGYTEAYWTGGKTENAVSAGDGTYARIDSVYLLANTGTPDNVVHCMVAQGTPAASPVAPTLPVGAFLLRSVTVPAGASTTSAGTVGSDVRYAIPYGASLGRLAYGQSTQNATLTQDGAWHQQVAATTMLLPTDRYVEIVWTARTSNNNLADLASYTAKLIVDGADASDGLDEISCNAHWERRQIVWRLNLAGGKTHPIIVSAIGHSGPQVYWRGLRSVEVFDRGVAQ